MVQSCIKLLGLTAVLMGLFSKSDLKQCGPNTIVIIRNVGIKLCQLRCIEIGQCLSYDYDVETLTCHLSRNDLPKVEKKKGYIRRSRIHSDVSAGSCVERNCILGQRCLRSQSGKAVCVQDEKQIHYEETQQHKFDKPVTSAVNPLHDACRKGKLDRVKHIVCRELVEVNKRDKIYGRTPLMAAAQSGRRNVVKFLVREGANVSHVDDNGETVLHWACRGGYVDMVELLVSEYRVEVNKRDQTYGLTPLMVAAQKGHKDVFDVLVSKGGNVYQVDNNDFSILHWACKGGHAGMVKHLVSECSADVNRKAKTGQTPLMTAALFGHRVVFYVLMSEGANVSRLDDYRDSILHYAAIGGHITIIRYIISQNLVDINSRGKYGRTPLMRAAYYGHKEAFEIIVMKGGLTQLVDNKGLNILHLACLGEQVGMVKYILSQNLININARDIWKKASMKAKCKGKLDVYNLLDSWD